MLIQGGTISSGTLSTSGVVASYWMQLNQFVLENHLAGCEREIAADLEGAGVGLADLEIALPGLDVLRQHVHAAHQVLAFGGKRFAQQLRIGQHEIRRRDRIGDLLDVERRLLPRLLVDFGVAHQAIAPLHGEQIDLLEEVEELVLRPFRIGEAFVFRVSRHHRLGSLAGHALDRACPQIEIGAAEARLHFERALRIGQPILRHLADGFDHIGDVCRPVSPLILPSSRGFR